MEILRSKSNLMKQYTIVTALLLALAAGVGRAQTKTGWELGGGATFGTTFGIFLDKKPEGLVTNTNPAPVLQFSTGVFARKFFREQFGIEFGAQYSSFGLRRGARLIMVDANGMPLGEAYLNNRRRYDYVELPLRFVYKKHLGKVHIGGFAGLSPAILVNSWGLESSNAGSNFGGAYTTGGSLNAETNPFNLFADVGLLVRADVYKSLFFEAKPHFRTSTIPVQNPSATLDSREIMTSIGVNLAVGWLF